MPYRKNGATRTGWNERHVKGKATSSVEMRCIDATHLLCLCDTLSVFLTRCDLCYTLVKDDP